MKRYIPAVFICTILFFLFGCKKTALPEPVTIDNTATNTPAPYPGTQTFTATMTHTPSDTFTGTVTNTLTVTHTPSPVLTATETVTPTCVAVTWYRDADSDGYGDPNTTIQSCGQPAGYVSNSTDCNDSDASIYPGNAELCDGKDNDCNGSADDSVSPPAGLCGTSGVCASSVSVCLGAGGWKCEYPDEYEINESTCDDGMDNDCDGYTDCDDAGCPCSAYTRTMTPTTTKTATVTATATATRTVTSYVEITDPEADHRTDLGAGCEGADILSVKTWNDSNKLVFMITMNNINTSDGSGAPQVQIAIDRNRTASGGETWFVNFPETQVSADAAWEYLAVTTFGSGSPGVSIYDPSWSMFGTGVSVISAVNNTIYLEIPWADIGGAAAGAVRFTIASFLSDASDYPLDIDSSSDAIDAITNVSGNTWNEVIDGVVDYYFDVVY